jgi:predicted amidophosphoribosyltransferase
MRTDSVGQSIAENLNLRVGAFFHNTRREPGSTCSVCRGPSQTRLCWKCLEQREQFGTQLADHVYPLTYVRGHAQSSTDQSAHTVMAYKRIPPAPKCLEDMKLMVLGATYLHGACLAHATGGLWTAVTFVSSADRPGPEHPAAELARAVFGNNAPNNRLLLDTGPGISDSSRRVRADRFAVPDRFVNTIAGGHVLVVEDTWVSGSKIQSAAVALKRAGAASVTGLCVARWCNNNWPDHRQLLDSCIAPYSAAICPVTGSECPATSSGD